MDNEWAAGMAAYGQVIKEVFLDDDENLIFHFESGTRLRAWDNGQSCCERRYMSTDDGLVFYAGAVYIGMRILDAPDVEGEYGDMVECQFLEVTTSKGVFTVANYNSHNGYYGGFDLAVEYT